METKRKKARIRIWFTTMVIGTALLVALPELFGGHVLPVAVAVGLITVEIAVFLLAAWCWTDDEGDGIF